MSLIRKALAGAGQASVQLALLQLQSRAQEARDRRLESYRLDREQRTAEIAGAAAATNAEREHGYRLDEIGRQHSNKLEEIGAQADADTKREKAKGPEGGTWSTVTIPGTDIKAQKNSKTGEMKAIPGEKANMQDTLIDLAKKGASGNYSEEDKALWDTLSAMWTSAKYSPMDQFLATALNAKGGGEITDGTASAPAAPAATAGVPSPFKDKTTSSGSARAATKIGTVRMYPGTNRYEMWNGSSWAPYQPPWVKR